MAAAPEHGRANEAVAELLTEVFGVRAADVELVRGSRHRSKRFRVVGVDPAVAGRVLAELLAS